MRLSPISNPKENLNDDVFTQLITLAAADMQKLFAISELHYGLSECLIRKKRTARCLFVALPGLIYMAGGLWIAGLFFWKTFALFGVLREERADI